MSIAFLTYRIFSVRRIKGDDVTLIPSDQQIIIIFQLQIPLIINIEILTARPSRVNGGEQAEIKIILNQPMLQHFCLSTRIQLGQHPVILSQSIVDISDHVLAVTVYLVVV
jgi:hypothetical protein